jgi:hypothetical protein
MYLSTLSYAGQTSCRKHFLYPEILLSVGVLLSHSVTHKLLNDSRTPANGFFTFCSWTRRVNGVSRGLATTATLPPVSCGRLGESVTLVWTCFWFNFCAAVRDCSSIAF